MRDVVITGAGLRCPLGSSPEALFDALLEGRSAVQAMPTWAEEIDELHCTIGAPVSGFDGTELPRKYRRSMGRVALFAVVSAVDAVRVSGLSEALIQDGRTGVVCGSTLGSAAADSAFGERYHLAHTARGLKTTLFFQVMAHTCATNVAMYLGITGEALSTNAACASSTQAMGTAMDRIRWGRADRILCGGADELHVSAAMTFDAMQGASRGFNGAPTEAPRPFDSARDGIVVGEGGGIFVLERGDLAAARGATVLARVLGYGGASDAVNMASPAPDGMEKAIRLALDDARLAPDDIDYVNAHATGTPVGDAAEAEALYRVFGDRVPVSSSKGHLGHLLGACGAIETSICIEAMRRGVVPPTRNLSSPDVSPLWLPTEPVERPVRHVLNTNFAFGGVNTALVLGRA